VVKKGEPLEPVRAALTEAVEDFAKHPPTAEEMERTAATTLNSIERSLNDPQQVGVALSETIALGDWRLFFVGRDKLATITAEQVAARPRATSSATTAWWALHAGRRPAARRGPAAPAWKAC
jgi:zinc protease